MGLADNLSQSALCKAPSTPSDKDRNFKISAKEKLNFSLIRNALTSNGAKFTTNHNEDTKQVAIDVINPTQLNSKTVAVFASIHLIISRFIVHTKTTQKQNLLTLHQTIVWLQLQQEMST